MRPFLAVVGFLSAAGLSAQQTPRDQAQSAIRSTVASALPPQLAQGASRGDLTSFLSKLTPEQKKEAVEALAAGQGSIGGGPAALAALSAAYMDLGSGSRALSAAEAALAKDPANPDALGVKARLLAGKGDKAEARALLARIPPGHPQAALVQTAIQLSRDASARGPEAFRPAALPPGMPAEFGRRIERLFGKRDASPELDGTLNDARGASLADLAREGIRFQPAPAGQKNPVELIEDKEQGTFTVSIRQDALGSADARAAAHVGNGLRQAQVDRDHSGLAWAAVVAWGWWTGAKIHKELAPGDVVSRPTNQADNDIMVSRRLLDLKASPYSSRDAEVYMGQDGQFLGLLSNSRLKDQSLFQNFINSTDRAKRP